MSKKTIEILNTFLWMGGGLFTIWYLSQSVKLSEYERSYIRAVLKEDAKRFGQQPANRDRILTLEQKF